MRGLSQRAMIEHYPTLLAERDLLDLYLYDTQMGRNPDAVETERNTDGDRVRVQLYRATGANGGYVVVTHVNCSTHIATLDAMNDSMRDCHDNYTLPLRLCLERVTVVRNRLCTQV